jgi:hypothetical protein
MAVTGVLQADFSAFYTAAQKAEVSLKGLEGGAVKVEASLNEMGTAPVGPINTLHGSITQVDQMLASAGINVGKYTSGLGEMAAMAGKTASQIGVMATGAAIFAAGMTGWKIGTWIGETTGWTDAIQKNIEAWMGWSAAATGTAAQTREFVQDIQDQNDAYAVSSERLAAAQQNVRGLSAATIDAIAIAQKNHATTEQITKAFGVTADGLRVLGERQKLAGQAADVHTKALEQQRAEAAALDKTYEKLMSDVSNANQLAIMEADRAAMVTAEMKKKNDAAANWIAANVKATAAVEATAAAEAAYLTEQDALTAATDALAQAHTAGGAAAAASTAVAVQGYAGVAQQVQITGDAIKEWINLMKYSAQVNAILNQNSLFTTQSQLDQIANLGKLGGGGGGHTFHNTYNIVDTESNIAKRVSDNIMQTVRAGTQVGTA